MTQEAECDKSPRQGKELSHRWPLSPVSQSQSPDLKMFQHKVNAFRFHFQGVVSGGVTHGFGWACY